MNKKIHHLPPEKSVCVGCHSCELMCALSRDGVTGPSHSGIRVVLGAHNVMLPHIIKCEQCEDHPCYEACPKKDQAMCLTEDGIVYVNEDACIGCGKCKRSCKYDPPQISMVKLPGRKRPLARKCDLCYGRSEVPVCVKNCSVRCLEVWDENKKEE